MANTKLADALKTLLVVPAPPAVEPVHITLLRQTLDLLNNCNVSSGICCCGDDMEPHRNPTHSAVDAGTHYADKLRTDIDAFLEGK